MMETATELRDAVREKQDAAQWYEVALAEGQQPWDFYRLCSDLGDSVSSAHHFSNEPWHPGGFVVRALCDKEALAQIRSYGGAEWVRPWEGEQADRDLYGNYFDWVMKFFEASSMLAYIGQTPKERRWFTSKLVHCVFNARGMNRWQEFKWGLRFAWGSAVVNLRIAWWRLTRGKEWWK